VRRAVTVEAQEAAVGRGRCRASERSYLTCDTFSRPDRSRLADLWFRRLRGQKLRTKPGPRVAPPRLTASQVLRGAAAGAAGHHRAAD
jgi:hypothetical protein